MNSSPARRGFAWRCAVLAVALWALFALLGVLVVRNGEPPLLAAIQRAAGDRSTLVAWWLTWFGYLDVLGPVAIALLIVAWRAPAWRRQIFFSIAMLLLCWRAADFFQRVFDRARPLDWVVKHETAFSYPSSHAAIAVGFYGLWAVMLFWSAPRSSGRRLAGAALALLAVGICWSRLALGAHYVTDLAGGALLAAGIVAAGLVIVPVAPFHIAGRPVPGQNRAV